ncbi:GEL complex subunit OPTI [Plodia interpunctella]|uniref:GEL complex subunit OPTI n=1 Tax=Plodia interpunctella TaxID=58824 RepID=UPI00236837CB|nr:respirasome Complex Assembly Factor 1 [Plodia interpunctella]
MSSKSRSPDGANKNKSKESLWTKAFSTKTDWPDKEEFLDVVYWMRQAIGIILGLCWGLLPLKGFLGLLLFVVVNAAVIYFYVNNYQNVDEEEFGGMWEITKEGFMTSFAGFLVTWIIVYTGLHGSNSL